MTGEELRMNTKLLVGVICVNVLLYAFADEHSKLSDEALRARFSEVQHLVNSRAALKSMGPEKALRTEFGTPTRRGIVLRSDDLDVTLHPVSGRILSLDTRQTKRPAAAKPGMKDERALAIAEGYVRRLGSAVHPNMEVIHKAFDPSTDRWNFAWQRSIDKYPFPEETVFIAVNDTDESLASFKDRTTDRKCPTRPVIDEAQAKATAKLRIKAIQPELFGKDYQLRTVSRGKLQIVYPNGRYLPEDNPDIRGLENNPQPRLVFSFDFTFDYTGTMDIRRATPPVDVWVDALTGDVIGGL
jgi:hypothetical protein